MTPLAGYVENDTVMAAVGCSVAWAFNLEFWGVCGQAPTEAAAVAVLAATTGHPIDLVERTSGDEQAFQRDYEPATADERTATQRILDEVRPRTIAFVESCSGDLLDWDDPSRDLPAFARWRTIRLMAWHIVDTESRYYLPRLGLPAKPRGTDLMTELHGSHDHVRRIVSTMPSGLATEVQGEVWTSTKVLRRLAWHERGELVAMHDLARRYSRLAPGSP